VALSQKQLAPAQSSTAPRCRPAPPQRSGVCSNRCSAGHGAILATGSGAGGWWAGAHYKTLCVRTCDGFFYPISFATNGALRRRREGPVRKSCPAAEVMLSRTHPGGGHSIRRYYRSRQPALTPRCPTNAFQYRQAWGNSCSCRKAGESWAQDAEEHRRPTRAGRHSSSTSKPPSNCSRPRIKQGQADTEPRLRREDWTKAGASAAPGLPHQRLPQARPGEYAGIDCRWCGELRHPRTHRSRLKTIPTHDRAASDRVHFPRD